MIAIGFGVAWVGYYLAMWGYCLVRDYNVPFTSLFATTWPGGGTGTPSAASGVPTPTGQPSTNQQLTELG